MKINEGTKEILYTIQLVSPQIWDNMTSIKQEQKQPENLKNTPKKLRMIVEIKWDGSKKWENLSGHR